ncbi:MAG: (d)CMP kinase [Methylophilaceae bacterium]
MQKLSAKLIPLIAPVIAIDGPSASGKGTVAQLVADKLGFHYLDSGALYRIVALAAHKENIAWSDANALGDLAKTLNIEFRNGEIYLNNDCITEAVRSEAMSRGASEVAIHPQVRSALLDLQHRFRQTPGLVADGRDMASVVFTDALLKIFLTASVEVRTERRHKQLVNKGLQANYQQILHELQQRDLRDSQRNTSPLLQTKDALLLDTTNRSIDEAVQFILSAYIKIQ